MENNFDGEIIQTVDGVSFRMKAAYDFGFLKKYGRVFKVFDDQDSGNICFGVQKAGEKYFVKFAGALTARCCDAPAQAVERLRVSLPVYQELRHPSLIQLVSWEEVGQGDSAGAAAVFRWAEGDCMGRMYEEAHQRFMALPVKARLQVYWDVLEFLDYVNRTGYVAIDFYDGSVMYNFDSGKTTICDVDFFRKKPCVNDMGRMWGSAKFMSPEEFQLGAQIDEATNVYTAGAMAFALFGNYERGMDTWQLSPELYQTACKAVSDDRAQRQQSIAQLMEEWKSGIEKADL